MDAEMAVASISQASFPPAGGSLALLSIPFIFTQDELLTTGDFIKQAKERGHNLSLNGLRVLHECRLLVPLYRVSDTPVQGRRIHAEINGGMNVRRWVLEAADDGRLRDSADEGYSKAWPYSRPDEELHHHWWNGFAFSSWQLLDLHNAINDYQFMKNNLRYRPSPRLTARARHRTLALAALSPRYLPSVLGHLRTPPVLNRSTYGASAPSRMCLNCLGSLALMRMPSERRPRSFSVRSTSGIRCETGYP